jgi:RNA polymerase sigma-70 factor (ECF subfamily)
MLSDPGLAEDVAQEALVRMWRHAGAFDPRRAPVAAWLLTITRNLAIDALRMRRSVPIGDGELERLIGTDASSASALQAVLDLPELRSALALLAPEQRRALVLAAGYGYTAAEVGVHESIPLGTAKTRIRTGMGKLRLAMAEGDGR